MPEIKSHPQGEPCWVELHTSDEKGALRFYSGLFGWKDDPTPMGPGQTYHMQKIGTDNAAALVQMGEHEKGMPPNWWIYISVKSADEAAKKAKAAGGKVMAEPFDVFDAGRMTIVQDPSGAMISFWQANKHVGYTVGKAPGGVVWSELMSRDTKKAVPFYKAVLGVTSQEMAGGMDYTLLKVGANEVAGVMAMPKEVPAMVPSYWSPYFCVANADVSVKKAASLGGKVLMPVQEIPKVGRFATIADPQGVAFGILQPTMP